MLSALRKRQELPADRLARHVFSTYASVRYGMAGIAFAFPLVLVVVGWLNKIKLQPSMSDYYWEAAAGEYPPLRIWFVGILFVVAAFLYLYKGFTPLENYALNVAGVCAALVALVPKPFNCPKCSNVNPHGTFAVALFLCIAYVALGRAKDTLVLVADETLRTRYRHLYRILGVVMVLSPVTAFVTDTLLTLLIGGTQRYVFFIETAGIYAFSAYWYAKSRELARTNAELHAIDGQPSRHEGWRAPGRIGWRTRGPGFVSGKARFAIGFPAGASVTVGARSRISVARHAKGW